MNSFIETLNHWGGVFLHIAGPMLWQSSLLITLVLAFDYLLRRQLRASIRYALWLVVLVKLILPPVFALPTSPAWWLHKAAPPLEVKTSVPKFTVTYDQLPLPEISPLALPVFVPPQPVLTVVAWLLILSACASVALFAWLLTRWWQITRQVRRANVSERLTIMAAEVQQRVNLKFKSPTVKLTMNSMSPAVCGLFRPTILIPQSLATEFADDQMRAVLLHELIHVQRRDVWVNFLQSLLQIVYWWHPLVWLANARIRRVREEAVDDAVMLAPGGTAEIYAPTLLEVAKLALNRPLASLGLVGILESRSALRQRIERLIYFNAPRQAGLTLFSFLGILVFSAVAVPMGERPSPAVENILSTPAISMSVTDSVTTNLHSGLFGSGILTNPNFLTALHELEQRTGTDVVAEPEVVTSVRPSSSVNKMDPSVLDAIQQETSFINAAPVAGGAAVAPSWEANTNQADPSSNRLALTFRLNNPTNEAGLKKLFLAAGVQMPPTVFVYGGPNGILFARGTKDQLALVYREVLKLNDVPPQDSEDRINQFVNEPVKKAGGHLVTTNLVMRTFKIDPRAFYLALQSTGRMPRDATNIVMAVRNFFTTMGVDLELPKGKSVFYNNRLGMLFVKATQDDLDTIDPVMQMLNQYNPQIHIKARFIEVPERVFQDLAPDLFTNAAMKSDTNGWHALLMNPKLQVVVNQLLSLGTSEGEELAEPEVVTTSGRQTRMQVDDGPMIDLVPYVLADGYTINLTIIPSQTNFPGYDESPKKSIHAVHLPIGLPSFSIRQVVTTVNLFDNQTLVLGKLPKYFIVNGKGVAVGSKPPVKSDADDKELLVFVTATIVDPAGNRVHDDVELPFSKTGFPEQPH